MRVGHNPKGGRIKTDARVTIDRAYLAHLEITDAVALSANGVTAVTLGAEAQEVTTPLLSPAVPRNLSVAGNVGGIAGDAVITGKNYAGEEIEETFALNGAATVNGNKAFKDVDSVELPAQTHTPTAQVETVAVTNECTQDGVIVVTVTAAGMSNSPKSVNVAVTTAESTTALVAAKVREALEADTDISAFFDVGGENANIVLTALTPAADDVTLAIAMVDAPDVGVTVGVSDNTVAGVDGVAQVETVEVTHAADVAGTLTVRVTAAGIAGSPVDVSVPVVGTKQVETVTVLGTIEVAGAGDASVVVTADGMNGSPKTISVPVANDDTASQVAGKIRTALGLDADVAAFFTVGGADAEIILTAITAAADDATMSITVDDGTSAGLTLATSENTTPGVAPDSINSVATKIRAGLTADPDVGGFFTVSGANANVILTAKVEAANDGTLAITLPAADDTGITFGASANTTPGVAPVSQVETIEVTNGSDGVGTIVFTVTANGMNNSPKAINVNVTADDDTAAAVATKARAALGLDADVAAFFTISGAGGNIILTAIEPAANDGTMEIAMTDTPTTAVTFGASANTTPGVPNDIVSVGWGNKLGLPYLLAHNTVLAAYLDNTLEGTASTVAVDADDIEKNTILLDSALTGEAVDIYLIV